MKINIFFNHSVLFKISTYLYNVGTNKKNKTEEIKIRLEPNLKVKYKQYCIDNQLDMSKHIREFIESITK